MLELVRQHFACPLCQQPYVYRLPREESFNLLRRDSDHCPHYKDENPLFYQVLVCPNCRFAAYREDFWKVENADTGALFSALSTNRQAGLVDFNQPGRSLFAALLSFQLAIACYQLRRFGPEILAGLALRAAWMCRYSGQLGREVGFLESAIEHYCKALDCGVAEDSTLDDLAVPYLLGELNLRVGHLDQARHYLGEFTSARLGKAQTLREAKQRFDDAEAAGNIQGFLKRLPIFSRLSPKGLSLLSVQTARQSFVPGAMICARGEKGESMYVISKGKVSVFIEGQSDPVCVLGDGEAVGEMSLLTGEPRSATLMAGDSSKHEESATEVIEIGRTAFRNILKLEPAVVEEIAHLVTARKNTDLARITAWRATHEGYGTPSSEKGAAPQDHQDSQLLERMQDFLELKDRYPDGDPLVS